MTTDAMRLPERDAGRDSTGLPLEGRADMSGSTLAAFIIPIVAMISLAALLILVYYADSHPEWKNAGQAPGHGIAGQASSPAAVSHTGSGELTDEPSPR
jgi:hypothetical protein